MTLQASASMRWPIYIGDVEGAFLETAELGEVAPEREQKGGLFCEQPKDGIPGVPTGALIRIIRPVYGLGDAPWLWQRTVAEAMAELGFLESMVDCCVYHFYENDRLAGMCSWHVDDILATGKSVGFLRAMTALRKRFPFGSWKTDVGRFCGTQISRDPVTGIVSLHQAPFA